MRALRRLSRVARHFVERERPAILMYHRVARVAHDPWQLAVWPERFAEQIEALVQLRRVVPLRWLAAELAQGRVPKKVAAVTFDDGYADILTEARPILERYRMSGDGLSRNRRNRQKLFVLVGRAVADRFRNTVAAD